MLSIKNLSYRYPGSEELKFTDLAVNNGESLLILGDSGTGKTTLLHLISGLLKGQNGNIILDNTDLITLNETDRDRFRGQKIGLVFQKPHLISSLTVLSNLLLCQYLAGLKKDSKKILALLSEVDLTGKENARISELSQGQSQRISVVRALLNDPKFILADEPTSSLDDTNAKAVLEILSEKTAENNASLIIATHDQRVKDSISNHYQL